MKSILRTILFAGLTVAGIASVLTSCDMTITDPARPAYTPVDVDANAGTWKTYVLTGPTAVTVAQPTATTSAAYQTELTNLKNASTNLSEKQQAAVEYWGGGAVFRWNEIARELSAKYNLPPASNANGVYPVPDPNNPLADPMFPFANPFWWPCSQARCRT